MEISNLTLTNLTVTAPPPPPPPPPPTGRLYAWGRGVSYRLGTGNQYDQSSPVQIGSATNWILTASTGEAGAAIKSDGTLWTWGTPFNGQNGQNGVECSVPTQLGSDTTWEQIAASNNFMAGIKSDGSLWMWGYNAYGQLGQGSGQYEFRSSPVQVTGTWSAVTLGQGHTLAMRPNGIIWAWGDNRSQQCNSPFGSYQPSPILVGSIFGGTPQTDWASIGACASSSFAINTSGQLFAWGANNQGQLGIGNETSQYSPTQVGSGTNWASIAGSRITAFGIKTDGTLWSWGYNGPGLLGSYSATRRSSPVQVGTGTTWQAVNVSSYAESILATKTDGTIWAWGKNQYGQLGQNDTVDPRSSPVQVGTATDWMSVSIVGRNSMLGIRTV